MLSCNRGRLWVYIPWVRYPKPSPVSILPSCRHFIWSSCYHEYVIADRMSVSYCASSYPLSRVVNSLACCNSWDFQGHRQQACSPSVHPIQAACHLAAHSIPPTFQQWHQHSVTICSKMATNSVNCFITEVLVMKILPWSLSYCGFQSTKPQWFCIYMCPPFKKKHHIDECDSIYSTIEYDLESETHWLDACIFEEKWM